ncbi:hypothetical protein MGU_11006 [Metarhizium guizhouense ARSEF 977]|uniref:Uncharacterized protein n=1 Tax=Metarhizium guizhouense (strain ARSEF 977) TaxID=1276136 RepID=A0A0B4GGR5_METGA|nr:hypothetical protein MGU_11006 [Metarhizium guizhouense ARSEF 977]
MTTMTQQKNPLRPCHQGITFVNDEPTCLHKKRMVRRRSGKTGKWFWACEIERGEGSCERYLYFDEVDKVKPLLPHKTPRTPRTPYRQQIITQYLQLPTPSTDGRSGSPAKSDGQDRETDPTRPAVTPTRRTTPSAGSETVMASGSTSSRVLGRKRPISPDASENSPSKKQQSEPQSSKDPTIRLLFPPTPDRRAANESHTNENDPSYVVGEDKLARRSSEEHASSQTGNGGSGTSPPHVARVPLGDADSNRL